MTLDEALAAGYAVLTSTGVSRIAQERLRTVQVCATCGHLRSRHSSPRYSLVCCWVTACKCRGFAELIEQGIANGPPFTEGK